eukprot:191814-Hanusia_phi.AAC.1
MPQQVSGWAGMMRAAEYGTVDSRKLETAPSRSSRMISPIIGLVSVLLLIISSVLLSSTHRGQDQLLQRGHVRSGLAFALAHGTRRQGSYNSAFRAARPRQALEQTGSAGGNQEFAEYLNNQDDILDEDDDSDLGRARQAVKDAKERVIEDAKRLHDIGVAIEEEEAKQNPTAAKSHEVELLSPLIAPLTLG